MGNATKRRTPNDLSSPLAPRLSLGPADRPATLLDGGWWPRSTDPAAELPGLVLALQEQGAASDHGPITHIMLQASDWAERPHRLRVEGLEGLTDTRVVRLSWFETLPAGLIVVSADGHRLDLLTVPPDAEENAAWAAMERAAQTGDPAQATGTGAEPAQENGWESEGGRVRDRED